jgi:hypothetical protein
MVSWRPQKFHAVKVKLFLHRLGVEKTNFAFSDIQRCIIQSLKAVQKLVSNSNYSF